MFSTQKQLDKKTGPYGVGRLSFLQSLVTEFQDTDSDEMKTQVLANLANFAYDPINYPHLRALNVIDLFIDNLSATDEKLVEFAVGGLCNLSLDKQNKDYINKSNCIATIAQCLSSSNEETVVSTITLLMFLVTPQSKADITDAAIVDAMLRFSKSKNTRISNLANVFLQDYCSPEDIELAKREYSDDADPCT